MKYFLILLLALTFAPYAHAGGYGSSCFSISDCDSGLICDPVLDTCTGNINTSSGSGSSGSTVTAPDGSADFSSGADCTALIPTGQSCLTCQYSCVSGDTCSLTSGTCQPFSSTNAPNGPNTAPSGTGGLNTGPGGTVSPTTGSGQGLFNPLGTTDLGTFLANILAFVVKIGTVVVVLMLVYVGFMFATAQGDPGKISTAREAFMWTIVGALILLGAQAIASGILATTQALTTGS